MTDAENSKAPVRVLIVDDDDEILDLLGKLLAQYNYDVSLASEGESMFRALEEKTFDLIILDVMMPGEDGFSLCRRLRAESNIPVIMLTAIGEATDRIVGLEIGADDYICKPFNPRELIARIKAVLRRTGDAVEVNVELASEVDEVDPSTIYFSGWTLVMATRRLVSPDDVEITLSAGEYDLLEAFVERPQQVLSRDQLLDHTRNRLAGPFDRSIDVQVSRLRQKIEASPKKPELIKTVRGGGYLFTPRVTHAKTESKVKRT